MQITKYIKKYDSKKKNELNPGIIAKYQNILNKKDDLSKRYDFLQKDNDDLLVILLRAESTRAKEFFPNGYKVHNTPYFDKFQNDIGKMVNLPHLYSLRNGTPIAVAHMLTRFKEHNLQSILSEKSVISVFDSLGFETAYISSNDFSIGGNANPLKTIILEAKHQFDEESIDMKKNEYNIAEGLNGNDWISSLQFLRMYDQGKFDKKSFVVVSQHAGPHEPYNYHPKSFNKFQPTCDAGNDFVYNCSKEEILNSYNNGVMYSSYLFSLVMEKVKDRNAIIIFSSDHGQSLGDDGDYGHGYMASNMMSQNQRNVASFVWMSDKYIQQNKDKFENIKQNSQKYLTHSILFHTFLDCANIESDIIEKERSLCSTKLKSDTKKEFYSDKKI
ncbi:sulfatase-like hydrolase/transferase [Candidatus Deianiraea vastatrix]|nr:sulfatase-like hydrolase/transferase [Candidatus Deianiraea vastatrix]